MKDLTVPDVQLYQGLLTNDLIFHIVPVGKFVIRQVAWVYVTYLHVGVLVLCAAVTFPGGCNLLQWRSPCQPGEHYSRSHFYSSDWFVKTRSRHERISVALGNSKYVRVHDAQANSELCGFNTLRAHKRAHTQAAFKPL